MSRILLFALPAAVLLGPALPCAPAATRTWDGGGSDNRWSTPSNWAGDTSPASGDTLRFPAGASRLISVNDLAPGSSFSSFTVEGADYEFTGNAVELTAGITVSITGGGFALIGFPLTVASAQTWSVAAGSVCEFSASGSVAVNAALTLDTPSPGFIRLNGTVSGPAPLTKTGSGTLFVNSDNTFTGTFTVQQGTLNCDHSNALGASVAGTVFLPDTLLRLSGPLNIADPLTVNGAILECQAGEPAITGPVTLNGSCTLRAFTGRLTVSGAISGAGSIFSIGQTRLSGAGANTWTGTTAVNFGTMQLGKPSGTNALPGNLTVGNNGRLELLAPHQLPDSAILALGPNARLIIPAAAQETIGGLVMQSSSVENGGELTIAGDVSINADPAASSLSGSVRVENSAQPAAGRAWTVSQGAVLTVSGPLLGHELRRLGPGEMRCTGDGSTIPLRLLAGVTIWNADAPASSIIMESGTLRGTGRTGSVATATTSAKRLEPGQGPGIFRTGTFTGIFGQTLALELNGTVRGTGYDSLEVSGGTVAPALTRLEVSVGYPAALGDSFIIVNNTGSSAVSGTFFSSGSVPLSEGRYLNAPGGHYFRISYAGGDGNDVVLTKVVPPVAQISGFSAVPGTGSITGFTIVSITAGGAAGLTYRLEGSTDLANWRLLTTFPANNAGVIAADFTEPGYTLRFYRFTLP